MIHLTMLLRQIVDHNRKAQVVRLQLILLPILSRFLFSDHELVEKLDAITLCLADSLHYIRMYL